jgi:hypothetical protein
MAIPAEDTLIHQEAVGGDEILHQGGIGGPRAGGRRPATADRPAAIAATVVPTPTST